MDFVEQHEGQDLADAWDRAQPVEGLGIVRLGGLDETQLQAGPQAIIGVEQREVHSEALVDSRRGKPFGHTASVSLVRELFMDLRQMVLAVGMLKMGQELSPLAQEMYPAPEEIARGPHLRWIDVSVGEHPAAEQDRHRVGVHRVVCGLAPVDGLHRERLAPDEGHPLLGAEVSQPVPGEQTFDADDEILPIRRHRLQEWLGGRLHIAGPQDLARLIHAAEIHGAGVPVDATGTRVLSGVKWP